MQTKNKFLALSCGFVILTMSSLAFANDTTTSTSASWSSTGTIYMPVDFIAPIPGATKEAPYAKISNFIKSKDVLSAEENTSLIAIFNNYIQQVKDVRANNTMKQEEKTSKIYEINKAFFIAVKIYVDSTKIAEYEKWIEEKLSKNNWYRNLNPIEKKESNNTGSTCMFQNDAWAINTEIKLTAKISAAYKVSLEWSDYYPKWDTDLLWYKIVVKNPNNEEKVVSVDENTTEKDDWNSKAWINTYKVYAITNDWVNHESNIVTIPMNWNGSYDFSLVNNCKQPTTSTKNKKNTWDIANVGNIVKDALNLGKNIVRKVKFQYKLLSEKTRLLVNTKIDSIPKEKREEYLKRLLVKIDKVISNTKWISLKAKLEELKQVVQERLDELSWSSSDDSVIQDLLNDSETTDSSDTTNQESK